VERDRRGRHNLPGRLPPPSRRGPQQLVLQPAVFVVTGSAITSPRQSPAAA